MHKKKMNRPKHTRKDKTVIKGRIAICDEKPTAETIKVGANTPLGIKTYTPRFQVLEAVTEAQKKTLERSGIKIVAVDDMVKRREKNVAAFRKMAKPGYTLTGDLGRKIK